MAKKLVFLFSLALPFVTISSVSAMPNVSDTVFIFGETGVVEEENQVIYQEVPPTGVPPVPDYIPPMPTELPVPEVVQIEVLKDDGIVEIVKPMPVPPPIDAIREISPLMLSSSYFPGEFYDDGQELVNFLSQYCGLEDGSIVCTNQYQELADSLTEKVTPLKALLNNIQDSEERAVLDKRIFTKILQKFYNSYNNERHQFVLSFVWVSLEDAFSEFDNIENLDWLEDIILGTESIGIITSINEMQGDLTLINADSITANYNRFNLSVDASYEDGGTIGSSDGYEVVAYFGSLDGYFWDWQNLRYAQFNSLTSSREFEQEGFGRGGELPNTDEVHILLMCNDCPGEVLNEQYGNMKVADQQSFTFVKVDNGFINDAGLEVISHSISMIDEGIQIALEYSITNEGLETLEGVRTNAYFEVMSGGPGFYEGGEPDRNFISASCNGSEILEDNFYAGNIILPSGASCVIKENVFQLTSSQEPGYYFDLYVESNQDQNYDNNNWSLQSDMNF